MTDWISPARESHLSTTDGVVHFPSAGPLLISPETSLLICWETFWTSIATICIQVLYEADVREPIIWRVVVSLVWELQMESSEWISVSTWPEYYYWAWGGNDSDHEASGGAVTPWAVGALALDAFSTGPWRLRHAPLIADVCNKDIGVLEHNSSNSVSVNSEMWVTTSRNDWTVHPSVTKDEANAGSTPASLGPIPAERP